MICCHCKNSHNHIDCVRCNHKICKNCKELRDVSFYLNVPKSEDWREMRQSFEYQKSKKMYYFEIDSEICSKWNFIYFWKVRLF